MSKLKRTNQILKHLHADQQVICEHFGSIRPKLADIRGKCFNIFAADKNVQSYIGKLVAYVLRYDSSCLFKPWHHRHIVRLLLRSKMFVHMCRLLSYIISSTWVPLDGNAEGLKTCASIMAGTIEYTFSKVTGISKKSLRKMLSTTVSGLMEQKSSRKRTSGDKVLMRASDINTFILYNFKKDIRKILNMITITHPRHTCLLSKSRFTFIHKPLTSHKQRLNICENSLITNRLKSGLAPESIYRETPCPPNYVHQLAIIELCFMQAAKLSTTGLFSLLNTLPTFIPGDVDIVYVVSGLIDMARSRLKVKFLEINENCCTCHAKCTGYNLSGLVAEELQETGFKRLTTISCCQRCMFSPLVCNTKARKPRIKICATNPALETCSLDNSSTFNNVSLYTAEYNGGGVFRYQHLFYTTNAVNYIQELSGKACDGPASQLYGMCFGGSRKCLSHIKTTVLSARKGHNNKNFTCRDKQRYMCGTCVKDFTDGSHTPLIFGQSIYDRNTCLSFCINDVLQQGFERIPDVMRKVCTGCKLKFLCRHTKADLANKFTDSRIFESEYLLKKIVKITQIVNKIKTCILQEKIN